MKRLGVVLFLTLVACAGGLVLGWRAIHRPFQGYPEAEKIVLIARGSDGSEILTRLESEGILESARMARLYLVHRLGDPPLLAGEYLFRGPLNAPQVLAQLIRGEVLTHSVTVVEGLTLEETAARLAAAGFGELPAFRHAMRQPAAIADLDPQAQDLEGYLYPDTYNFARGTSEAEIVAALARTFRDKFTTAVGPLLGSDTPNVRALITLASIVEKEARLDAERPLIAAVYANRLRQGIGLYADPTVIYALTRLGRWDGNLRRADLELQDPYNTYRNRGLPPGPICSPGVASMVAAAAPAPVPYLYFVSRNDGSHVFAKSLDEHNRNVERWQKQYWRDRWQEEGAGRR